jgi:hypothetical protein
MCLPAWGPMDADQPSRLQRAQAVADIACIASQGLDKLIMAPEGHALGAPIFSHQALEDVALQL